MLLTVDCESSKIRLIPQLTLLMFCLCAKAQIETFLTFMPVFIDAHRNVLDFARSLCDNTLTELFFYSNVSYRLFLLAIVFIFLFTDVTQTRFFP